MSYESQKLLDNIITYNLPVTATYVIIGGYQQCWSNRWVLHNSYGRAIISCTSCQVVVCCSNNYSCMVLACSQHLIILQAVPSVQHSSYLIAIRQWGNLWSKSLEFLLGVGGGGRDVMYYSFNLVWPKAVDNNFQFLNTRKSCSQRITTIAIAFDWLL